MVKKVLFVGLGSAGQRHLRNLLEILGNGIEVLAYRFHKSERVFGSNMQVIENETLTSKYKIQEFYDFGKSLNEKPDIVVIANPNSMHMPYALETVRKGIDLFIEKPLSTTMEYTQELIEIVQKKGVICQVGFQYRHHPCICLAKEYLDKKKLGEIVSVSAEVGESLARMHSYEDYHGMLEAKKELGGGVVLCQSHELDYLYWLFGVPVSVNSSGGKRSGLDIDVEDSATTFFRYKNGRNEFSVTLHQDFLQYPAARKCKIVGTEGKIEFDLLGSIFLYEEYGTYARRQECFDKFNRNDMFLGEMRDFLNCVETRKIPECDVQAAVASLKIGLAIKESFKVKKEIKFDEFFRVEE